MKKLVLILIFALFLASLFSIRVTKSFFSDTEKATSNILSVATEFSSTPTPSPTPIPTPTPSPTPLINHVVINEVFYFVDDDHKIGNSESGSEWVELYNPTAGPVPLTNWSIEDNTTCDNFPGSPSLQTGGFAILSTHTEAEFRAVWTSIPSGVVFIQSPTAIGNGLANNDELILRDVPCGGGSIVDHISWGSNISGLNPSISMTARGHSSERDPDGKDTNTATDFVDRSPPTPGN